MNPPTPSRPPATLVNLEAAAGAGAVPSLAEQLAGSLGELQALRERVRACEARGRESELAWQSCEVARARPCTNVRPLPEVRVRYEQCYAEQPGGRSAALATARRVDGWRPADGVAGCAARALRDAPPGAAGARVALYQGGCYAVSATEAPELVTRHGLARAGACGEAFDERGASLGGAAGFALYSVAPRAVAARAVRVVRTQPPPAGQPGDAQILAVAAYGPARRPLPLAGVALTPDGGGSSPAEVEAYARAAVAASADADRALAGPTAALRLDDRVGAAATWELADGGGPVETVVVRPRSAPGDPAVERRLVGCAVRLLGADGRVVHEWPPVRGGAAEHVFEVR